MVTICVHLGCQSRSDFAASSPISESLWVAAYGLGPSMGCLQQVIQRQPAGVPPEGISQDYWKVTARPSLKLLVVPGLLSLNHSWKFQDSPGITEWEKLGGKGTAVRSKAKFT